MVHLNWTFKAYVKILKTILCILILTVTFWIALSQPNLIVLGVCTGLCLTSLIGLLSLKRTVFAVPLLALIIILVYIIVITPSKGLTTQITKTLQFLILILTVEVGISTINFNGILQRMKGQTPIQAMTKAIKRYMANVTAIITASFTLSTLFLFLGNLAQLKFEPIFLVAAATAILLTTLAFLAINLRHPTTGTNA